MPSHPTLCPSRATQCSSSAVLCVAMSAALCLGNAFPHEPLQLRCRSKLSRAVPQLCGSEQRPCGAYPVHAVAVRVASVLCRRGANLGSGRASLSRCGCDRIRALPCRSGTLSCRAIALLSMPCSGRAEPCRATAAHSLAAPSLNRAVLSKPSPSLADHALPLLRVASPTLAAALRRLTKRCHSNARLCCCSAALRMALALPDFAPPSHCPTKPPLVHS
jgi:hypothetical protein